MQKIYPLIDASQLSREIGRSRGYLRDIMRGNVELTEKTAAQILAVLNKYGLTLFVDSLNRAYAQQVTATVKIPDLARQLGVNQYNLRQIIAQIIPNAVITQGLRKRAARIAITDAETIIAFVRSGEHENLKKNRKLDKRHEGIPLLPVNYSCISVKELCKLLDFTHTYLLSLIRRKIPQHLFVKDTELVVSQQGADILIERSKYVKRRYVKK